MLLLKETMQVACYKDNGLWWRNYGGTGLAFKRMSCKGIVNDTRNIKIALNDGWVLLQGTTKL
jgi:hypothetical protein